MTVNVLQTLCKHNTDMLSSINLKYRKHNRKQVKRSQNWLITHQLLVHLTKFFNYGAKLLNADWLRKRAFLLMLRVLLVIKKAGLLDIDWLTVALQEKATFFHIMTLIEPLLSTYKIYFKHYFC